MSIRIHGNKDEATLTNSPEFSMTTPQTADTPTISPEHGPRCSAASLSKWRNIVGFWLLGLLNNYPYVIMLSAAFDIIHSIERDGASNSTEPDDGYETACTLVWNETTNMSSYRPREKCQHQGTSMNRFNGNKFLWHVLLASTMIGMVSLVILLADVLPTFFIKLVTPYFMHFIPYWIRVNSTVVFCLASFLLVALTTIEAPILLGVVCASISSGFGEIVFLSLTARYHKSTVSAWSSGTGAAGMGGAAVYAVLKTFLSPKVTLLIQLFVPLVIVITYFVILGPADYTDTKKTWGCCLKRGNSSLVARVDEPQHEESVADDVSPLLHPDQSGIINATPTSWVDKVKGHELWSHVRYIPHLFQYMLPLFLVYAAEYSINQGLFELLYNPNTHIGHLCLDQHAQYRWLQVMYQVGVLVSRSSVSIIHIRHFWILALLQVVNFVFLFVAAKYLFIPCFWLTFVLIFYEGLLGGGVYVNAFYSITKEVPEKHREFSMGVASVADSTGICVAALCGFLIHNYMCSSIGYIN